MKRIAALVLSILLIVAMLPVGVSAATNDEIQKISKSIENHYKKTLRASGMSSLQDYCGLLASYQLTYLGINRWAIFANGKDQYDIYKNKEYTDMGYRIKTYAAPEYTLETALNAASRNGTRDVYNILVGFQSTNTSAGSRYGHAMVIYAILNGRVYFTESYNGTLCTRAGKATSCTIAEFAKYYASWTRFEGIAVFGQKEYLDNCTEFFSNMYVQVNQPAGIYTQPCTPESGETACSLVRMTVAGERLLVTALYENTLGQYYYQVEDGGATGYIPAENVAPVRFNYEDITVSDAVVPGLLKPGSGFTVGGEITSVYSSVEAVEIDITDQNGEGVYCTGPLSKNSGIYDLKKDFNLSAIFKVLEEGIYVYSLYAVGRNTYVQDGQMQTATERIKLCSVPFAVGSQQPDMEDQTQQEQALDGWVLLQGRWHYFENGAPRTGWFCYDGVDYYLKDDGSVTTGWVEINGKDRFFSDTGAMRTGWMKTDKGTMYLLSNGEAAHGWKIIDDGQYYFDDNGLLKTSCWISVDDSMFYLQENGQAAKGWVTLKDGKFFFQESDGSLLAQAVVSGGKTVLRAYDAVKGSLTNLPTLTVRNAASAVK